MMTIITNIEGIDWSSGSEVSVLADAMHLLYSIGCNGGEGSGKHACMHR